MKKPLLIIITLFLWGVFALYGQGNHYVAGSFYINSGTFAYIAAGDTVHIEGNITTARNVATAQRGMLSFAGSSGWVSSNGSFVNGYVRSHKTDFFVFPVGQGSYRPAAVSNAADAAPTDAAYYNTAQYSTSALGDGVLAIRNESWIIQGTTPAVLTLSWSTNISAFAANLNDLCVAGWDNTLNMWVEISSTADATSPIFGVASHLGTRGSVSTTSAIVPNSYAAYTLGVKSTPLIPCPATITDDKGNTYKVTALAGLCWTENLRTPAIDDIPFGGTYTCSECPAQLDTIFGLLYTWYAAVNICPDGWRIPTQAEWGLLQSYPASQLKSTKYWLAPQTPGTDDYGFNALPAGWYNSTTDRFHDLYGFAGWWASDTPDSTTANYSYIAYYCNALQQGEKKRGDGLSVRCVME